MIERKKSMKDNVNSPAHYTQGGIECIEALKAATVGKTGIEAVCAANVIKYVWRYEEKNGLEDVKKAQWYLDRLIKELENKTDPVEEEDGCCNCKYRLIGEGEPCDNCRNNFVYNTEEYFKHGLLYERDD